MPATAFITPLEAAQFVDPSRAGVSFEEEAVYTALISAICEAMEQYLRRQVVARPVTKAFDGRGSKLRLPHVAPGVLSVTSVEENGAPLTADVDYLVYPEIGHVVRLCGSKTAGTWAPGLQTVKVSFAAGVAADAASVPENLKLCAKIAFKFFAHMGWDDFGKQVQAGAWFKPDRFPPQCLFLMDPYRVVAG